MLKIVILLDSVRKRIKNVKCVVVLGFLMQVKEKVLLRPKHLKASVRGWVVMGVLNPAAVRLPNKKIMLYARVAEMPKGHLGTKFNCPVIVSDKHIKDKGYKLSSMEINRTNIVAEEENVIYLKDETCRLKTSSHFRRIILDKTGFEVEKIDELPSFTGTHKEGQFGVEDPSIVKIGSKYYMTYVSVSLHEGVCTSLAVSKDLKRWKRNGIIFREQNKDVSLFPEKIKGHFVALHRPEGFFEFSRPSIWISHSRNTKYWGKEKSIMQPRANSWETERVGAGTTPLKIKEGWLEIYHGVKKDKKGNNIYSAGAVLFDKKNPAKIIARSPKTQALFSPKKIYERKGFINNVVFPSEAILDLNGKDLLVFSGAGDSVTTVKKVAIKDIISHMHFVGT